LSRSNVFMLATAILFLAFVAYQKLSLPLDTVAFNPATLYRGTSEGMVVDDPREYYMRLNNLTFKGNEEDECFPFVVSENNAIPIPGANTSGNYLPIVHSDPIDNFETLIGAEGEELSFKDKQNIIMPVSNSKFKNSNFIDSTINKTNDGKHNIEIIKGDRILIVIEDVMTWWCHSHNPSEHIQHDVKVGHGSNIKSIRGGAIVGVAKASTKIKIYEIKDHLHNDNHKIDDVKDISELDQINAGVWLTTGTSIKI
jgi:hypothetical protein